jgi:type VI protein secretion system component VasK
VQAVNGFPGSFGVLFGVMSLLSLAGLVLWVWALVDAIRVPDDGDFRSGNKLIWVLIIALTGFVEALIYLVIGRPAPGDAPRAPLGQGPPSVTTAPAPPPPPPPPPASPHD